MISPPLQPGTTTPLEVQNVMKTPKQPRPFYTAPDICIFHRVKHSVKNTAYLSMGLSAVNAKCRIIIFSIYASILREPEHAGGGESSGREGKIKNIYQSCFIVAFFYGMIRLDEDGEIESNDSREIATTMAALCYPCTVLLRNSLHNLQNENPILSSRENDHHIFTETNSFN